MTLAPFAFALEARNQCRTAGRPDRCGFSSAVLVVAAKKHPSVPGILAEDRNRGLQTLRKRRCKRPVGRDLDIERGL